MLYAVASSSYRKRCYYSHGDANRYDYNGGIKKKKKPKPNERNEKKDRPFMRLDKKEKKKEKRKEKAVERRPRCRQTRIIPNLAIRSVDSENAC